MGAPPAKKKRKALAKTGTTQDATEESSREEIFEKGGLRKRQKSSRNPRRNQNH